MHLGQGCKLVLKSAISSAPDNKPFSMTKRNGVGSRAAPEHVPDAGSDKYLQANDGSNF